MLKITVLLPVKNGEKYIAESMESILRQTFEDFELLIFDDDSSDRTMEILQAYNDSRIKIFTGNDGFIANLNKGLEIARGLYIARMDADDIMLPLRLETQLKVMENQPVDVCSSWRVIFGEGIEPFVKQGLSGIVGNPLSMLYYYNFIVHPAVMIRKEFFINNQLHYENYPHAEDYKLWFEAAKRGGVFYIIPKPMLFYRMSNAQVSSVRQQEMDQQSSAIRQEIAAYLQSHS